MSLKTTCEEFKNKHVKFVSKPKEVIRRLRKFDYFNRRNKSFVHPAFMIYDVETTGLDPWAGTTWLMDKKTGKVKETDGARVFCFGVGLWDGKKLYCLYIDMFDLYTMLEFKSLLENKRIMKIGHNIKFDMQVSMKSDIEVKGPIFDTLTATRLTHEREPSHTLKYLGAKFTGKSPKSKDKWDQAVKEWLKRARTSSTRAGNPKGMVNYSFIPEDIMIPYVLDDIYHTFMLYERIREDIYENYDLPFELEIDYVNAVVEMERVGVKVDKEKCLKAWRKCTNIGKSLITKIKIRCKKLGMDKFTNHHTSVKKLCHALGAKENDMMNQKGEYSSDAYVLEKLIQMDKRKFKILKDLINYRRAIKLGNTYFLSIYERASVSGILHCQIKPSDTKTGRSASAEPNLQNIPRITSSGARGVPTVRSMFIPRRGFTNWYFDYSQIEMRIFALFCREQEMLAAVNAGEDLHMATARLMYGKEGKEERQKAKNLNFGIIYGMGIKLLAGILKITLRKSKSLMDMYLIRFPGIDNLVSMCKRMIAENGYVEDMFGRRYHISMDDSYMAVNAIVQGASAMVLKMAMLQVNNLIEVVDSKANALLPVHDELMVEIPNREKQTPPLIKLVMEDIAPIKQYDMDTLVDAGIGNPSWGAKEEVKFSAQEMRRAKIQYQKIRDEVVYDYPIEKVTWFMQGDVA